MAPPGRVSRYRLISTIAGVEACTWPKNSRHTVRMAGGIRWSTNRADVINPSQPSFCTPGSPARNLSVTSLPSPALRNAAPGMASVSRRFRVVPSAPYQASSNVATSASWILPRLWSCLVTSSHSASGVTIRHETRLSSAVPHSTAFLPPAFIATLPPMHDASADVGSTAKTSPAASAASITRFVTTPAPQSMVGIGSAPAPDRDGLRPPRGAAAFPC